LAKRISKNDPARALAIEAARIAEKNNAEEIVVLNLRDISPVADYFVICTGSSDRQMRTVADEIARYGQSVGQKVWHVAGERSGQWIVMDFVDVVVHIFGQAHRRYYDLELIWGEAPKVRWRKPRRQKKAKSRSE
jgi:ribosome-associated protein